MNKKGLKLDYNEEDFEKLIKSIQNQPKFSIEYDYENEEEYEFLLGFYEGITRKTPNSTFTLQQLRGFYTAIILTYSLYTKE